ncbi:hypothetical protein BDF22DRAFT_741075 [Syncephalis plumigaleata]|nr:hypothetical protein BDF22DRAFT_741075 [Syncephalis plumigaleata]
MRFLFILATINVLLVATQIETVVAQPSIKRRMLTIFGLPLPQPNDKQYTIASSEDEKEGAQCKLNMESTLAKGTRKVIDDQYTLLVSSIWEENWQSCSAIGDLNGMEVKIRCRNASKHGIRKALDSLKEFSNFNEGNYKCSVIRFDN